MRTSSSQKIKIRMSFELAEGSFIYLNKKLNAMSNLYSVEIAFTLITSNLLNRSQ